MTLKIETTNPLELSKKAEKYFDDLSRRVFNRFDRNNSICWLSLVDEIPTYKFGKFCFMPDERAENRVFIGLYIEKGLGKGYCNIFGKAASKKYAMDSSWKWHSIVADMKNGKLAKTLNQVADATGVQPTILVSGRFSNKVVFEPGVKRFAFEHIYFNSKSGGIQESDYIPSPDNNPLGTLRGAESLSDLAARLEVLPESDFIWIDLSIVLPFEKTSQASEAYSMERISKNVLAHFEFWVA